MPEDKKPPLTFIGIVVMISCFMIVGYILVLVWKALHRDELLDTVTGLGLWLVCFAVTAILLAAEQRKND